MLFNSLFVTGALALQASAFLIPLEVAPDAGILQSSKELKHQVLDLNCPECPFPGAGGDGSTWSADATANSIHLEFDIPAGQDFLQINGQPVFPPPKTLVPIALTATQTRESDQAQSAPLLLGYVLEILPTQSEVSDVSMTPIQFTILSIQGVPIKVDTIKIDILQSWGHSNIARVSTVPYADSPGIDRCTTSICRLRAIIAERLRKTVEATKKLEGQAKTWITSGCRGKKHANEVGAEQEPETAQQHHQDSQQGRLRHAIQQTVRYVVIPVLFGLTAYFATITLGILVGHALVFLWTRFRRGGRRGATRVVEIAVTDDEKDALVEGGELPPQYEDVEAIVVEEHK